MELAPPFLICRLPFCVSVCWIVPAFLSRADLKSLSKNDLFGLSLLIVSRCQCCKSSSMVINSSQQGPDDAGTTRAEMNSPFLGQAEPLRVCFLRALISLDAIWSCPRSVVDRDWWACCHVDFPDFVLSPGWVCRLGGVGFVC